MTTVNMQHSIHTETAPDIAYIMSMDADTMKKNPKVRLGQGQVPSISATKVAPIAKVGPVTIQADLMKAKHPQNKESLEAQAKAAHHPSGAQVLFRDVFAPRYRPKANPWPRLTTKECNEMPRCSAILSRFHTEQ